jgi:hypothetical protein
MSSTTVTVPLDQSAVLAAVERATAAGLCPANTRRLVGDVFAEEFPFHDGVARASSLHIHIKVADVDALDTAALAGIGAEVERTSTGYVKYHLPEDVNLIFSSFPIAEDDLVVDVADDAMPYVDHMGVDLRDDSDAARAWFSRVPIEASRHGWVHRYQGAPVFGCHAEVEQKHWVYPPDGPTGAGVPIELPLGPLTLHDDYVGCDLRPIDPRHALAGQVAGSLAAACGPVAGGDTTSGCSC